MNANNIHKLGRGLAVILFLVATTICPTGSALADSVRLGSDYFQTLPGTSYDFPPIGNIDPPLINFRGRPFGPNNPLPIGPPPPPGYPSNAQLALGLVDTIVQRQEDAIVSPPDPGPPPVPAISDTILIEMVALSLESVAPVNIGGSFFDVFVHLTPGTQSLGQMTINHEFADNGTPAPEGTFSSFFDIFFTVELTPVGGGTPVSFDTTEHIEQGAPFGTPPAFWSHEPPLGTFFVDAPPFSDQVANRHLIPRSEFADFYPTSVVVEFVPGQGQHVVRGAPIVPEPSTVLLLGSGLAGIAVFGRRRLAKKA